MVCSTLRLVAYAAKMMFNHLRRALTTPSMFMFYAVTILGAFVVSLLFSYIAQLGPLLAGMSELIREYVPVDGVIAAVGFLSLSAVLVGYFGAGPISVFEEADEYVLMPAPVHAYQVFVAKYTRRLVRKAGFVIVGVFIAVPLIVSSSIQISLLLAVLGSLVIFFEYNFLLGALSSMIRMRLALATKSRLRHLVLIPMSLLVIVPSSAPVSSNVWTHLAIPANNVSMVLLSASGVVETGVSALVLAPFTLLTFFIVLLIVANSYDSSWYEAFSTSMSRETSENRFAKVVRGEVDFSDSMFNDPMAWIILKDFWSRMRSPLQFWKYVYVVFGTVLAAYLLAVQPSWLRPAVIPGALSYAAVPAFLLVLTLLTQVASMSSLLSFTEEKDNIYLLKSSPFRRIDIVLAKYAGTLMEVSLSTLPLYGFLLYFFRVEGSGFLITLGIPMILVFCATGILAGAYVPVFTNDPANPPVPIAFSFPAINFSIGGLIIVVVATLARETALLVVLPLMTLGIVGLLIGGAVKALDSYK